MWASLLLLLTVAEQEPELVLRPLVTGRHAMVASLSPLASTAGMRILLRGGNAFDAAVATAVAVAVVDPKNSTIGGQGFATIYVARTKEVRALNFFGPAPRKATVEALQGKDYTRGYLATPVPSNLKGYQALLEYGTMSWADVLEPAIELAEDGFILPDEDGPILEQNAALFTKYPSSARVFLPEGRPPRSGEVFVQKDLARTLRAIAGEGPDVFYRGDIARKIAAFYGQNGGILDYEDLAGYQARWVTPIVTEYRGLRFHSQPPNSSAAALLLQLNLLEPYDLKALGHNSAGYLHLVGEVMRIAIADRNRYVADPDFTEVPVERLLSKEYARARGTAIRLDGTMPTIPAPTGEKSEPENTTHLTVVDSHGNMVALTQTLGAWFGSGVVAADTGVVFSNQMRHLHLEPDSPSRLGPGRRPRSNQSPTIVLRDGEPFMALGTPGNDAIWQRLTQVIANVVDHGMDIQSAIEAPRMIYGGFQEHGTEIPPVFEVESRISPGVVLELRARGYQVEVVPTDGGRVNGILRDPRTGFLYGAADPRGSVYVVGW
jgi:gamma-glutamyltranspeptidase/glutathione hydrolase